MNQPIQTLRALVRAIEQDGCGLSWTPYRDAKLYCVQYVDGHNDGSMAAQLTALIVTRWKNEGCALPISL